MAMKNDIQLRRDVTDELEWEPSVDATQIGVAVKDGIVTLTGEVTHYAGKLEAERLVKTVAGVKAVANDVQVRVPGISVQNDTEIAEAALNALKWHTSIPSDKVQITVRDGFLTLEGHVDWQFQREAVENAVRFLKGVKGVSNMIKLAEKPKPKDVKAKIEAAFKRNAEVDAGHVQVETQEGKVILKGKVGSWTELSEAERVAWTAPGVTDVDNRLTVGA
jgi:osmotically-inducible protein OsmY